MASIFNLHVVDWREPLWLLLALQPLIIYLIKNSIQKNSLSAFADKKLQPWIIFPANIVFTSESLLRMIWSKNTAYILAWLLIAITLAGPRTPISQNNNEKILGANIMLVIDMSRSMKATDIEPNRLSRVKVEINEFLDKAKNHRVGITVFSARAHVFVPLTSDHAALKTYLKMLDNLTFPTLGSNPVDAILLAKKELEHTDGKSAIILITDGERSSELDRNSYQQLNSLNSANIPLYILGAGTVEGEAIQLDNGRWLEYKQKPVISQLQEDFLSNLASRFRGAYSPIYDDDADWNKIYDNGISLLNSISGLSNKQYIVWNELYIYFLIPSILFFMIALTPYQFKSLKNSAAIFVLLLFMTVFPDNKAVAFDFVPGIEKEAYKNYQSGNYKHAADLYQKLTGYISYYGYGSSLYKMGHYQEAKRQYTQAILHAKSDTQRINALFNLANAHFRTGDFTSAISTYEDVLRYQAENSACLYNIKISRALKKNIELRINEQEALFSSTRQGKGPRSSSIATGTNIRDNTSVSIGDSTNISNKDIPLPDLPDLSEATIKKLLQSGLDNIKLAKSNNAQVQSTQSIKRFADIVKAKQQIEVLTDNQHLLWKRIFEMEQGFPAPVEKPHTIPGVNPW